MIKKFALLVVAVFAPLSVFPCSISGLQHEVVFSARNAAMGVSESRKLAEWFVQKRDEMLLSDVSIYGIYPAGDKRAEAMTSIRAKSVEQLLKTMNSGGLPIDMRAGVSNEEVLGRADERYDHLVVVVAPACAKTGTCCSQSIQK